MRTVHMQKSMISIRAYTDDRAMVGIGALVEQQIVRASLAGDVDSARLCIAKGTKLIGRGYMQNVDAGPWPILAECWFLLAQYGPTPVVPRNWKTWTLWQYTDGAVGPRPHMVKGIGRCDRDKFNGSEAQLRKLWGAEAHPKG